MARAVVSLPSTAKRGDVVEVKALVQHAMETGFRRTQLGEAIPRDIIRSFVCTYDGEEVFRAELHPAISANPLITFSLIATASGTVVFKWTGDRGFSLTESAKIAVA